MPIFERALNRFGFVKKVPPVPLKDKEVVIKYITAGISYDIEAYQNWQAYYWNPNPVMKSSKFTGYKVFEGMDGDGHVYNAMSTRKEAILSRPFYVRPAVTGDPLEETKAAFIRWQFDHIKEIVQKRREIQSALDYGFSVSEMVLEVLPELQLPDRKEKVKGAEDGAKKTKTVRGKLLQNVVTVSDILTKVPSAFSFDKWGNMHMVDVKKQEQDVLFNWGTVSPAHRMLNEEELQHFLVLTHDPRFGSRYGWPLKASFFWDYLQKKAGKIYRMIYVEKYGMPYLKGEYPSNTSPEDQAMFETRLKGMQKNSYIMTPEGFAIEFVTAMASGSIDVFGSLMEWCDGNISEVTLGHRTAVSQTDAGSPFSNTEVKTALRQDKLEMDATQLDAIFNDQFIPRLIDMNFTPNGLYPYCLTDVEPEQDLDKALFRYSTLHNMGVDLSLSQIRDDMAAREPDDEEDTLPGTAAKETPDDVGGDNLDNTQVDGFQNKEGSPTEAFQNAFQAAITKFYEDNLKLKENGSQKRKVKKLVNRDPITKLILSIDEEEV